MNSKKTSKQMIALMSRQSLKSSRMRNVFVMVTIVLASALLMAIMMFAAGQREENSDSFPTRSRWAIITDRQAGRGVKSR